MESNALLHLHAWLSGPAGQRLLPFSFVLMLLGGGGFLLFMCLRGLTPEAATPFRLQRAATAQEFGEVVLSWSDGSPTQILDSIRVFRLGTLIFDTIWPLGYGLLGMLVLARLTRPLAQAGHAAWALFLISLFILAVLFDFAENIQSIRLLSQVRDKADLLSLSEHQFVLLRFFTRAKWNLIVAGLLASAWLWVRN